MNEKLSEQNQLPNEAESAEQNQLPNEAAADEHTPNFENAVEKKSPAKKIARRSVSYLAKIAMLSALGVILLMIEFPLFAAVPYLKMNISDVPALLAAYMFGPISGALVNVVKVLVDFGLTSTTSAGVGEISNLVSGSLYAFVAGCIYIAKKSKKSALISLVVSSIVFCVAMWLFNQFLLLPMYGIDDMSAMMTMLWWTLLFNVIKTTATSIVTFFLYKHLHRLFNRF